MPKHCHFNPPTDPDLEDAGIQPTPAASPSQAPPRVLIIRPTALGDVSRTVPALVTLRRAMPHAQIDWLVNEAFVDVIRHHPDLNHLVAFPRQRLARIARSPRIAAEGLAWARRLRAQKYDLVFDFQGLFRSGLFAWITAAKRRVGWANAREMAWLGYNQRHRIDPNQHTVDHMLALLDAEGYPISHDTQLYVGPDDQQWLDNWLSQNRIEDTYACIAPTARWPCKCWPIEKYTAIARKLLDTGIAGNKIVILAAPNEQHHAQQLLDTLDAGPHVIAPTTTVGQMMAILSRTQLLVCNDSAPLHIAVGFNRPIAAIFGPTDPARVGPYRRDDSVIQPTGANRLRVVNYRRFKNDQSLISQVGVDEVWEKILEQLKRHDPKLKSLNT